MIRKVCPNCRKHTSDDCDNYDMRPLSECFIASDAALEEEEERACHVLDEAKDRSLERELGDK